MNELNVKGTQKFMEKEIPVVSGGFGEGKKCICDKTVAEIHNQPVSEIRRRIGDNISRFKKNVDFIDLKKGLGESHTLSVIIELGYTKSAITQAEHIYLLSERGYAKLIKIMDTDLAWEIHDKLIDEYFEMREMMKDSLDKEKFLMCLQGVKFLSDDMAVPESSRLFMYNGLFEEFGLPTSFIPHYEDNGNRERCSATELLKRNGCGIKTAKFNQLMISSGYMELKERPTSKGGTKEYKKLTDKGLKYGLNLISNKNQKETQLYYYADTFMDLYGTIAEVA